MAQESLGGVPSRNVDATPVDDEQTWAVSAETAPEEEAVGPPETVWIFHGEGARFSAGVFTSREQGLAWAAHHAVSGMLTEYLVGDGCYDIAVRDGHFRPRKPHHGSPRHVASFSPSMEHVHIEDGSDVHGAARPLELAAMRIALNEQPSEDLPMIAAEAIERGLDSPALRDAAGTTPGEVREARDRFVTALGELGIDVPDHADATWQYARRVARQILDGDVAAYEGAEAIWSHLTELPEDTAERRDFCGLASEWEDKPNSRAACEASIREEAAALLRRRELRP